MKFATVEGVQLWLSHPIETKVEWVGQTEVMEQLLACWLTVAKEDLPLCPRLVGKPGLGKTTLAMAAAKRLGQPVYIYQCTMDTRPEDLLVTPVLSEEGKIRYHASPVVTAMIEGGICILDEGNRMSEKSWASLAPLLDHRRYIESLIAGIKVDAHPNFRCCVTMNDDASTYELPDYIMSRVQPMIEIEAPSKEEELAILKYNLPFAPKKILEQTADFLARAQGLGLNVSPRDGIQIIRYILKRKKGSKKIAPNQLWDEAISKIVGPEAVDLDKLEERRKKILRGENKLQDLWELFRPEDLEDFLKGEGEDLA